MEWLYLLLAIFFEVAGTTLLKLADGLTKIHYFLLALMAYLCCFTFLSLSLRKIDLGVAYAIWGGLGIAAISAISIIIYDEEINFIKSASIIFIITGIVGLKLEI